MSNDEVVADGPGLRAQRAGHRVIGGRKSHEALREVLGGRPTGKVLDAPSGSGVLSVFLRDLGWQVHCADLDRGIFTAGDDFPFETVDLNRALPYEDASFDAVVCANGLHRLFNPAGAISEFFRILRPGGSLHVTVNHYASLDKRLRFLFTGSIDDDLDSPHFVQTIEVPEANVRHALLYPGLAHMLEGAGFRIAQVRRSQVRRIHRALLPLAWLIRLGSLFVPRRTARSSRLAETRSSALLPGGKYLYVEAVKA